MENKISVLSKGNVSYWQQQDPYKATHARGKSDDTEPILS